MKFARLKLHGFKSFSDPTDLIFEPGLTGIVGPNGCGKSNLVEALRWVMGESSYKAMRASGMDDVIFSGSANRPGRNSAEVTLVLDNTDRTAPAPLNNADILEITRRIEREAGSVYRVNGREVRARDVQLLFADASTGAHSPALVRQGQIGELISAKPVQRRALLEEAAGISGLHSRRHEAELRLRAAEQNLERVDDIIAQVETQLDTLKKQARQAVRYRSISGDIKRAEATLFHLRWVRARFAEKEAEAEQGRAIHALAEATKANDAAEQAREAGAAGLMPLREAEAKAGAVLQRYRILAEQLEEDVARAARQHKDLTERHAQLEADASREGEMLAESISTLGRYQDERTKLNAASDAETAALAEARAKTDAARQARQAGEAQAQKAADAVAEHRARRAQAERSAGEATGRAERLGAQVAQVESDLAQVMNALSADAGVAEAESALRAAERAAQIAETEAGRAEQAAAEAEKALEAVRPDVARLQTELSRLESEAATLDRILKAQSGGDWPALVDRLKVQPGYETALGAALGDDLEAGIDARAPIHWAASGDGLGDPVLPEGAVPLSRFVSGEGLVTRRLEQIGLVSAADGAQLMALLKPGQRLVTREGALWRWDGLVAAADAPTAAAQRLSQRNRLSELADEIAGQRRRVEARRADAQTLQTALEAARGAARDTREAWRAAQREIGLRQKAFETAQARVRDLTTRRGALEEARVRLKSSHDEALGVMADARTALAALGDGGAAQAEAETARQALAGLNAAHEQAQMALAQAEAAARGRADRLEQVAREIASWTRRQDGATAQIETLKARARQIAAELEVAQSSPDGFAARRARLADDIERATAEHKAASDALALAEQAHRDTESTARQALTGLGQARETLGRIEERLKGLAATRVQIEEMCVETLEAPASRTAELAGIRPEDPLPDERQIEARLDRLRGERERLGGVNLRAEQEAEEVRERLETMVNDREDLIAAIAKLRTGIQSLNREGRARLTEAFEKVNAHFQDLFTSLFGGGTAELTFVESDDPLQAGLEIIARPPGKKPQTMTLLSGGEQALTAMSLIFAVFLTNPAPICVLDEVDAPLDDANVERFCNLLDTMCEKTDTRFMVITHNPITMARTDRLFGVTMAEKGVSQLVSVDLTGATRVLEAG